MGEFDIGDRVIWKDTQGRKLHGEIIAKVDPWVDPVIILDGLMDRYGASPLMYGSRPRDDTSYLVLVKRYGKGGKVLKSLIMRPDTEAIKLIS